MNRLSRRNLLANSALLGSAWLLPEAGRAAAGPRPQTQPNILFILADDLGYADLSCYGRRDYETPVLDRLAREGVRFTQAYANSAVCSATRLALITGRYQYRLPAGLEEPIGFRDAGLPPEHPTMPSLLRQAGYSTALIGKWHLGALPDYGPLLSGYDEFWGIMSGGVDYYTHEIAGQNDLWDGSQPVETTGYLTDLLADRTIDTIGKFGEGEKPFLISLHFTAPHWPWEGPATQGESESRRIAASPNPLAVMGFDSGSAEIYAAMVQRMDFQIGRILDALSAASLADDTIVVFTSDNGGERFSDVWPFSGRKTELLEGGLRVPAIIRWPDRLPRGVTSDATCMSMDWMPTFLAAAGAMPDPASPLDGQDILPSLLAESTSGERTLFWRYHYMEQEACRSGDWKYLKIRDNTFLFNLSDDPMERANLKNRYPHIYTDLVARYRAWEAQMLPIDSEAFTTGFGASELADHFGVTSGHGAASPSVD